MIRNRLLRAIACLVLGFTLSGCLVTVVSTEHDYVLVHTEKGALTVVADDDPLYTRFDSEILSDPYLQRLLSIYGHVTEGYQATDMTRSLAQAIANKPIIVTDSAQAEVMHNIEVDYEGERIPVDLALGLGPWDSNDLTAARSALVPAMASWLLDLMALKPDFTVRPKTYELATPSLALRAGFEEALEAVYGRQHPEMLDALRRQALAAPEARERLLHYEAVPANELRFRFAGDAPTKERRSREEAMRTPGVVATFLYRLIEHSGSYYPQRYMLWFTNFDAEEIPYAKVLLAVNRIPQKQISVQNLIASYIESFPAEKASVLSLADEVFGQ